MRAVVMNIEMGTEKDSGDELAAIEKLYRLGK